MEQTSGVIDWNHGTEIFLNPRWPEKDKKNLYELAHWAVKKSGLKDSIWLTTSGSSADSISKIKLVGISKDAFLTAASAANQHLSLSEKDCWGSALPIFHVGGLSIWARAHQNGAKAVKFEDKWSPHLFGTFCEAKGVTITSLVPTQLFDIVSYQIKCPPLLRAVILGGGRCSEELLIKAHQLGWNILPSYGMTECSSQIATALPHSNTQEHLQEPFDHKVILPHVTVRVRDIAGRPRIEIKSPALLSYYAWIDNGEYQLQDPKKDGWFLTEDEGSIESNRILRVFGRSSDYFKIGGESTSQCRLNDILEQTELELPSTFPEFCVNADSIKNSLAVLPIPSNRLENQIALFVKSNTFPDQFIVQIATFYNLKVLPFEKIRSIYLVSEIPLSSIGKILPEMLKQQVNSLEAHWELHQNQFYKKGEII